MYRFAICAIFVVLCLVCLPALAQDTPGTHVCVGTLAGAGVQVSGKGSRDTLIKFLAKQKKPPLTLAPLESIPDDNLVEAKQKACEYVVRMDLVELHTESGYLTAMSGAHGSVPNYFVTISYKLNKLSDGSEVSSGTFKAQDTGSPQNAVGFALNKIAAKVDGAIKGTK